MTLRTQVILLLLVGLAILYTVFFTQTFIDRHRLRLLPPSRRAEAVPYRAIILAAIGLGCVTFALEYLIFGTRPLPYPWRASPLILCGLVLASAALKRLKSR